MMSDNAATMISMEPINNAYLSSDSNHFSAVDGGILVLDKPEGITSFALVAKTKGLLGLKKVGHCGTLDPFATGVMILCINQATRISDQLSLQDKLYRFTIHFGKDTDTLDRTGRVVRSYDGPSVPKDELLQALIKFTGCYQQQVPRYAAVKVEGKRLYELSRKGIEVDLPQRKVTIHQLQLLSYHWPIAALKVHCSKGTYVRQLAADIGQALQCGAHVSELRRLASGDFNIAQAISLEDLKEAAKTGFWRTRLLSINEALAHLPAIVIDDPKSVKGIYNGRLEPEWELNNRTKIPDEKGPIRLLTQEGHLLALWWPESRLDASEKKRCLRVFK